MAKTSPHSKRTTLAARKRHSKPAPGRSAPRSATTGRPPGAEPGPEHWRYLEALTHLLGGDEEYSTTTLAKRMGMSFSEFVRFRHERQDVMQWASDRLQETSRAMVGPVLRKCAELARAGSAEHAEVLIRFAGIAIGSAVGAPAAGRVDVNGPLVINVHLADMPEDGSCGATR